MGSRVHYLQAVHEADIERHLAHWEWTLAGTPPLGIEAMGSDIDVICSVENLAEFSGAIWRAFSDRENFRIWQWVRGQRCIVANFRVARWDFEIFGSEEPLREQAAVLHFEIEERLLKRGGEGFAQAVRAAKYEGRKTEPAFAELLGLKGDAYQAMLDLHVQSDSYLDDLLERAGYGSSACSGRTTSSKGEGSSHNH
ncbi:DUF4269 domain-containing protein [Rhizobium sp. GCM10022189]|uniref:DUF4269 domain-containing protein n=1 Tax=Rhizobium sp. GCM10022189 TaxID=3252654 RepID=UPI00362349EF